MTLPRLAAMLRPPSFADEQKTHAAYMLHVVLWAMVLVPLPYVAWALLNARELGAATVWRVLTQSAIGEAVNAALIVALRRGHVRLASILQVSLLWTFFLWSALSGSGIRDLAYVLGFPIVIGIAGLLLGLRGALAAAGASVAAGGAMLLAETGGRRFGPTSTPGLVFAITAALFPIFATLQYLGFRWLRRALEQAHQELSARRKAEEERERLQGELAHAQRVESIGRLAGGIAHDFNNLLTSILGNIAFAQRGLEPGHPLREPLEEASGAVQSAANLTQQLLAFSRRQLVRPRVVSLNEVVAGVEKMLRRLLGEDVILRTVLRPEAGHVRIDPGQLEQILVNLSVNARDAMPAGGWLLIETGDAAVDANGGRRLDLAPGPYVLLRVADTGVGMSREVRQQLFEPFFTTKEKGTGLGLATAYGILKQNGGAIAVSSEEGKGTTFDVYLPRVQAPVEPAAEKAAAAPPRGGSESILLVEDDPLVRRMAMKALRTQGYDVVACGDGAEALTALAERAAPIALVITDVVMPHMDGRELSERLAAASPGLKVLFTSGYAEEVVATRGVLPAGIQFIAKPYTPDELAGKVREVLDG
ncbi:MAG TPA: response regulator [Anaeromyxobacteraceae bacterium]|nr:response regulator [Anaeromyxobacteraceae bacterium]